MKCILLGGSGEVGGAVARALIKSDVCSHLTLLGRRTVTAMQNEPKVEQFKVETGSAGFEEVVKEKAQGHDAAISCIGIGSGTTWMREEQMMEVEVKLLGKYARGCKAAGIEIFELLTAVGTSEKGVNSRIKAFRVMGYKHKVVRDIGFKKLAIFKPGIIVGNAHTPNWIAFITALVPDSWGWGNIRQQDVARAFVAHLEKRAANQNQSVVSYGNKDMKSLIQQ